MVSVDGGRALVRVGPTSGCPTCDRGEGCGAGVFGRLLQRRPIVLRLDNRLGAAPGDVVTVGIPERLFLFLVMRLYLLPLLAGLAGAAFGHHLGTVAAANAGISNAGMIDAAALAGALVGLFIALPRSRKHARPFTNGAVRLIGARAAPARNEDTDLNRNEVTQ